MQDKIFSAIINIALKSPGTVTFVLESAKEAVLDYRLKRAKKKLVALRKKYELEQKMTYQENDLKIISDFQNFIAIQNLDDKEIKIYTEILLANTDWVKLDRVMPY